jgi:hypothetical protein
MPSHTSGADSGIDSGPSFFSSVEWVAADVASSIENEFLSSRAPGGEVLTIQDNNIFEKDYSRKLLARAHEKIL